MIKPQNIARWAGGAAGGAVVGVVSCVLTYVAFNAGSGSGQRFLAGMRVPVLLATIVGAVVGGFISCRPMNRRQRILGIVALFLWLPMVGMFGEAMVYAPLKFRYLIWRVASAQSPVEERAALELADRWGGIWEVHLESPPGQWLDSRDLDAVVGDPARPLAVELEWWETKVDGAPYRVCRKLSDKNNIYVLLPKARSERGGE